MELISQHVKSIMEGCKERARSAGLRFQDETLEYIVTNRDLLELSPKVMIPTLYDYWVHDVEVLKEKGKYELYPHNPYETVINTRPPISFYNDNNPDWLNVMIFYHVLAHIDFFQNNQFFRHTWDYDFTGEALSDKRVIAKLRAEKGRWVDYVIEFARGIDNLVGYHHELSRLDLPGGTPRLKRLDYYFDIFLQTVKKVHTTEYLREVDRYNESIRNFGEIGEQTFFADARRRYPEFEELYVKAQERRPQGRQDLLQYLLEHSRFLSKDENRWMRQILEVVRKTSIFFQPQIRTKIMNEGWASYWHEQLFLRDDRISGHEVEFARINAGVTSMPKVGLNPYALGMRLFYFIEEAADRGRNTYDFQRTHNAEARKKYDAATGRGREAIFRVRENFSDFTFIKTFIEQDFVDQHKLFVVGKRLNQQRMVWEYYVKSRRGEKYRDMVLESLYHPPHITIDGVKKGNILSLKHHFEGKPLVRDYIANTMMGIEYLWGGPVQLETSDVVETKPASGGGEGGRPEIFWRRVVYTMKDRRLSEQAVG